MSGMISAPHEEAKGSTPIKDCIVPAWGLLAKVRIMK